MNQHPVSGPFSLKAGIYTPRNQGSDMGMVPLTITPNDPLGKFLFSVSAVLSSADLEISVPSGRVLLSGDPANITLNWKLRLPPGSFGLRRLLRQQGKNNSSIRKSNLSLRLRGNLIASPQWRQGRLCLECKRSFRGSLDVTMSYN